MKRLLLIGLVLLLGCAASVEPPAPAPAPIETALPTDAPALDAEAVTLTLTTFTPSPSPTATPTPEPTPTPVPTPTPSPSPTPVPTPKGLLGGRYDGFYYGEGHIKTDDAYISDTVSLRLTRYDSSPLTKRLVYYVLDIHIQDVEALRTESWDGNFGMRAKDGKPYTSFLKMARRVHAITAITGDYYTYTPHAGLVFRNGELYLYQNEYKPWKGHNVLLLMRDGSMRVIPSAEFTLSAVDFGTVWQGWEFGPSLLNDDGTARSEFDREYNTIQRANPRTVLGYYEPGHYCFVTVDGRKTGYSNGLTLAETAQLMESLHCTIAFNLDGGQTTQFYWNDKVYNTPYKGGRFTSDIIYIRDTDAADGEPELDFMP